MPETSAGPNPLPEPLEERVRAYFAAFLSPHAVQESLDELHGDVSYWGDHDEASVLRTAHAVLTSRLRIDTDVEILVLIEDAGLDVPTTAEVLHLPEADVQRMYDEALAVLEEELPSLDGTTGSDREVAPAPDARATVDDEQLAILEQAERGDRDEASPRPGRPAAIGDAPRADQVDDDLDEEGFRVISSSGAVHQPERTRDAVPPPVRQPGEQRARRYPAIVASVVLLVLLGLALQAVGSGNGEGEQDPLDASATATPSEDPTPTEDASTPSAPETEPVQSVPTECDEPVCIGGHRLVSDMEGSSPAPPQETFTVADDVRLWFAYALGTEDPVRVSVLWYREDQVLYELRVRLPRAEETTQVILDKREQEPADYRVEVLLGERLLFSEPFTVAEG